uniref:Uncharacterized protein n=2 Tax=Salix viminalis TaxID=40686 RepID=A0A6N2MRI8_SALVM
MSSAEVLVEAKVSPPMNVVNDRLFLPLTNSRSNCSQVSIEQDSKSVYQSKALPFKERTNCFTMRSPLVPALLQVSTK